MWIYSIRSKDDETVCRKETVQTASLLTVGSHSVTVQLVLRWSFSTYTWSYMAGQNHQHKGWNGPIPTKCLPEPKISQLIRILHAQRRVWGDDIPKKSLIIYVHSNKDNR